jgi:hypothetical protein
MEVGAVQEDARVIDQPRRRFAVLLDLGGALLTAGLELPLIIGESPGRQFDPLTIVFVGEMSAVTTATLHEFRRRPGQDSLATLAEDALPVAFDERRIDHPGALVGVVFEADPLVGITWN